MNQFDRLVIAIAAVQRAVISGRESGDIIPTLARQCSVPPDLLAWGFSQTEQQTRERAADVLARVMQ